MYSDLRFPNASSTILLVDSTNPYNDVDCYIIAYLWHSNVFHQFPLWINIDLIGLLRSCINTCLVASPFLSTILHLRGIYSTHRLLLDWLPSPLTVTVLLLSPLPHAIMRWALSFQVLLLVPSRNAARAPTTRCSFTAYDTILYALCGLLLPAPSSGSTAPTISPSELLLELPSASRILGNNSILGCSGRSTFWDTSTAPPSRRPRGYLLFPPFLISQ